jgi:hypothetical protein
VTGLHPTGSALEVCRVLVLASVALFLSLPNVEGQAHPKTVQVPNLIGSTLAQAKHTLELGRLRLGTVTERSSNQTGGVVVEQDPRPGERVLVGSSVNLVVSGFYVKAAPRPPNTQAPGQPPPVAKHPMPYPSPTPPKPSWSGFSAVDDLLAQLPLGRIVFNVPSTMALAQSYEIKLLLSASRSLEELQKELPGKIEGAEIRIAPKMEARLTGQDFTISAVKPEIQGVSGQETTEWEWEVRPLSSGAHQLHLTINVILFVNGVETPRSITTFDKKITVEVSLGQRVFSFIANNWQWLWTAVLIPVVAWLWKKKKTRQAGAKT